MHQADKLDFDGWLFALLYLSKPRTKVVNNMAYITKIHILFIGATQTCITCIPLVDAWKYYTNNQMDCAVIISQSSVLLYVIYSIKI